MSSHGNAKRNVSRTEAFGVFPFHRTFGCLPTLLPSQEPVCQTADTARRHLREHLCFFLTTDQRQPRGVDKWVTERLGSVRVSQMCSSFLYPLHPCHCHGEMGTSLQARSVQQNHADDAHVQRYNLTLLLLSRRTTSDVHRRQTIVTDLLEGTQPRRKHVSRYLLDRP